MIFIGIVSGDRRMPCKDPVEMLPLSIAMKSEFRNPVPPIESSSD